MVNALISYHVRMGYLVRMFTRVLGRQVLLHNILSTLADSPRVHLFL